MIVLIVNSTAHTRTKILRNTPPHTHKKNKKQTKQLKTKEFTNKSK